MKSKAKNRIFDVVYLVSALAMIIGGVGRILEYPYIDMLIYIGASCGFIISIFDKIRLEKIIKKLEKEKDNKINK